MTKIQVVSEHQSFQKIVRELQTKFTRFYTRFLSRMNLTLPQFALVSLVYHDGDAQMNSFAKRLMISLPAVTHLVDRLERDQFVRRLPHKTDRRITMIRITEKGKRAVEETQGRVQLLFVNTLGRFKREEQKAIQAFYSIFSNQLEEEIHKESGPLKKRKGK
jgi:DNA-binding MarR family transcriptional regulator